ncbi:hypothetical protein WOLCODRAFT_134874 [Wolfiporia cocos MD-104 SS10]|uniref:DUF202 domain-containing protein n=1 Tax=Wolfiporia cocos (strain MD-104) TaxID=742152 RepID=A0A2H3ITM9_WOLCO|nr:hypothetical protein WOLCODRAFT_134874 [Wolfiporia cocos MD-104 SS10]
MSRLLRILRGHTPLPNTGSTARDHLANERTFLAWTRTALGLVALGIGVERFERFSADMRAQIASQIADGQHAPDAILKHERDARRGRVLSITLLGTGALTMALGTARYYATLLDLQRSTFRPNTRGVALIALGCAGVTAAVANSELRR